MIHSVPLFGPISQFCRQLNVTLKTDCCISIFYCLQYFTEAVESCSSDRYQNLFETDFNYGRKKVLNGFLLSDRNNKFVQDAEPYS